VRYVFVVWQVRLNCRRRFRAGLLADASDDGECRGGVAQHTADCVAVPVCA
jgi:hypothetical protein